MKSPYLLRENLHHSNPPMPIARAITPKIRPKLDLRGDSVAATIGVPVGDGVMDGLGAGVIVAGPGVNVAVAGGVMRRSIFCSGRMTEVLFSPFQLIRSESETS